MRQFTVMIKPASSLCNMRCRYCFYNDVASLRKVPSYGIMSLETVTSMLSNIFCDLDAKDRVTFAFQGGEPLLAGIEFFEFFVYSANTLRGDVCVEYTIQTNGTLLDETWCAFFKKYNFLVGLSMDGSKEIHDANRVDKNGEGTYRRVIKAKSLLDEYGIEYNVLAVLTNELAEKPEEFWKTIRELGISYVQLIPCLGELEGKRIQRFTLTPHRFADFYIKLFELWKQDYNRNEIVSVKLFDDILNLLVYKICTACGMTGYCSPQLVIEADGSAYPCDFYVLDEYKIGDITKQTLLELLLSRQASDFLKRPNIPMNMCKSCRYKLICGGGCKRMYKEVCGSTNSFFCGYKCFLDAKIDELCEIAEQVIVEQG